MSTEQKLNKSHLEKINGMNNDIDNLSKALETESSDKKNVERALLETEKEKVFFKEKLETAMKEFHSLELFVGALNQKLLEVETSQLNLSKAEDQLINEVIISLFPTFELAGVCKFLSKPLRPSAIF